jgi:hypothetical protein
MLTLWPTSFTAWVKERQTENYYLEEVVRKVTGQHIVPIGDAVLSTMDTAVGCETCEELFTPLNPSTYMGLNGVEIILNSSASHAELRKLRTRLNLISNSTRKVGGVYVYANATGVDGEARMMFDGSSMIITNGKVLEQGAQFSLKDVEVTTATFDIEEVRSFRSSISRNVSSCLFLFPQLLGTTYSNVPNPPGTMNVVQCPNCPGTIFIGCPNSPETMFIVCVLTSVGPSGSSTGI